LADERLSHQAKGATSVSDQWKKVRAAFSRELDESHLQTSSVAFCGLVILARIYLEAAS
jgi:hypothetical protein